MLAIKLLRTLLLNLLSNKYLSFEIGFFLISSTVKISDKTCVGCDDGLKPLIIGIFKYF